MRIVTPQDAAFNPSGAGPGSGLRLVASYSITEDVSADFGPLTVPFFTPIDGYYLWALFVKTNIAGGAGAIAIAVDQPGSGLTASVNGNLAATGLGGHDETNRFQSIFAADGVINVVRQVSGFAAANSNYSFYANMYILAG